MISDQVKQLEQENHALKEQLKIADAVIDGYKNAFKLAQKELDHSIPVKLYHCKRRGNTTIKFKDGSSVTVKKKANEKDCIDTAIAYAILKHLYPKSVINNLKKEMEEK